MTQVTQVTTCADGHLSLHVKLGFWEVCGMVKKALDEEVEYLDLVLFCFKLTMSPASLVVQWLRIRLPMQGTRV